MSLIIPRQYRRKLLPETTEVAIKMVKDAFQILPTFINEN